MHKIYFILFALFLSTALMADDKPAQVAVATAHPIATAAGLEILNAGGNAFDAAVAVSATLAVVEPYSSGIGGGGFWLLHRARDGRQVMVDGRERAPLAAHRDMYLDTAGEVIPAASVRSKARRLTLRLWLTLWKSLNEQPYISLFTTTVSPGLSKSRTV